MVPKQNKCQCLPAFFANKRLLGENSLAKIFQNDIVCRATCKGNSKQKGRCRSTRAESYVAPTQESHPSTLGKSPISGLENSPYLNSEMGATWSFPRLLTQTVAFTPPQMMRFDVSNWSRPTLRGAPGAFILAFHKIDVQKLSTA